MCVCVVLCVCACMHCVHACMRACVCVHISACLESADWEEWMIVVYFMINLHKSYVAELGFRLATSGSALRHTNNCAMEPGTVLKSANIPWLSRMPDWLGGCRFDPCRVGDILLWSLIMKYFLWSFSPFHWFKKVSGQFLAKECAQVLNNR